jgi:hypothetical protein
VLGIGTIKVVSVVLKVEAEVGAKKCCRKLEAFSEDLTSSLVITLKLQQTLMI